MQYKPGMKLLSLSITFDYCVGNPGAVFVTRYRHAERIEKYTQAFLCLGVMYIYICRVFIVWCSTAYWSTSQH